MAIYRARAIFLVGLFRENWKAKSKIRIQFISVSPLKKAYRWIQSKNELRIRDGHALGHKNGDLIWKDGAIYARLPDKQEQIKYAEFT